MKAKKLGLAGLGLLAGLTFTSLQSKAQSLESQLKILSGELLLHSQSDFARTLGKALSISGEMQHQIEVAEAGRDEINIEQNNFPVEYLVRSEEGKYFPAQGYEWVNPNDATDFRLRKIGSLESRATLAPFDKYKIKLEWGAIAQVQGTFTKNERDTGIGTIFTCNWYKDLDNDRHLSLAECQGVKRTFNKDEKIEIVGVYGMRLWDIKKKNFPVESVVTFSLYRGEDGKLLGEEKKKNTYTFTKNTWIRDHTLIESTTINPGNLNPGKYVYSIKLSFPNHSKRFNFPRAKSGEFEIIE